MQVQAIKGEKSKNDERKNNTSCQRSQIYEKPSFIMSIIGGLILHIFIVVEKVLTMKKES